MHVNLADSLKCITQCMRAAECLLESCVESAVAVHKPGIELENVI